MLLTIVAALVIAFLAMRAQEPLSGSAHLKYWSDIIGKAESDAANRIEILKSALETLPDEPQYCAQRATTLEYLGKAQLQAGQVAEGTDSLHKSADLFTELITSRPASQSYWRLRQANCAYARMRGGATPAEILPLLSGTTGADAGLGTILLALNTQAQGDGHLTKDDLTPQVIKEKTAELDLRALRMHADTIFHKAIVLKPYKHLPDDYCTLAGKVAATGDTKTALKLAQQAETLAQQLGTSLFMPVFLQGSIYRQQHQFKEALAKFQHIIDTEKPTKDQFRYEIAVSHLAIGQCLIELSNNHAAAQDHFRQTIALHKACTPQSAGLLAEDHYYLAESLKWAGKGDEAKKEYLTAVQLRRKAPTVHYPTLADLLFHYAHAFFLEHKFKEALPIYQAAMTAWKPAAATESIDPQLLLDYGDNCLELGDKAKARELYELARQHGSAQADEHLKKVNSVSATFTPAVL